MLSALHWFEYRSLWSRLGGGSAAYGGVTAGSGCNQSW